MDLSVITVTWNSSDFIAEQIRSVILGCNKLSFEQIIIDNASTDNTASIILEKFPSVKLIKNNENMGFGRANNQGAKIAKGEFFLILNPDMRVVPDSLSRLIDWMREHPDVGIAGCKLTDMNGNFTIDSRPRRFPKVFEQVCLLFKLPHLFPSLFKKYLYNDFDQEQEQVVDSVRGAFMLIRRDIYEKLGYLFDPRYFLWFEEVDLCREALKLDYKVVYTPIVSCVDYVGQSFKKQTNSVWKQKHFSKSMLSYFQKWEPWYKWIWVAIFRPFGMGLTYMKDMMKKIFGINLNKWSALRKEK